MEDVEPSEMAVVAGGLQDVESLVAMKDLLNRMGSENLYTEESFPSSTDMRSSYILNSSITGIEEADLLLIVGSNPRYEAPLVNTRIRKSWIHNDLRVAYVGPKVDLTYDYEHLGESTDVLKDIASGEHAFSKRFKESKNPMIIVGSGSLQSSNGSALYGLVASIANGVMSSGDWPILNVLHRVASQVGALDVGYRGGLPADLSNIKLLYLLGADSGLVTRDMLHKDCYIVYQGHHGDRGVLMADAILPGAAYTEKMATYVNTEGRSQQTRVAVTPPGMAREDWQIIRALSEITGHTLPYDDLIQLQARLIDIAPHIGRYGDMESANFFTLAHKLVKGDGKRSSSSISSSIGVGIESLDQFYMTDPISRASQTMAKCVTAVKDH
jgi:NADH dehydrogenase (ubiquinone) Fe-S protein 1